MVYLFIGSTGDQAGHTLITWAIARRLLENGLSIGFMKPFGTHPTYMNEQWIDHDAFLFKEVLNLREPLDRICPYLVSEGEWSSKATEESLEELKSIAQTLSKGKDVLIIMGSNHIFFDDRSCPIPDITLVTELKAELILINRFEDTHKSIYSILFAKSMLRDKLKGIVLNRVPPETLEEVQDQMVPFLHQKGIRLTAVLPENPALSYRTLREIQEIFDGEVICGKEKLDRPVGRITVGATDLKGELVIFKRAYNKIILLAPVPPDQGVEKPMEHRTVAGILLTGGRKPVPQTLKAAENTGIPLILVKDDTFSILQRLEQGPARLSPQDQQKIRLFTDMMDREKFLDGLFESIGTASK